MNAAPDHAELPVPARQMTAAEARGFRMACDTLELWGHRIERAGAQLGGDDGQVPVRDMMRNAGRMVHSCARSLSHTLPPARG